MGGVNTLFSKFTEFWDKEFIVASLIPAAAFTGFFTLASAWALGMGPTFLWLQQDGVTEIAFVAGAVVAFVVIFAYCLGALREIFMILWSEDFFRQAFPRIVDTARANADIEILEKWIDQHGALDLFPVELADDGRQFSIKQDWESIFPPEKPTLRGEHANSWWNPSRLLRRLMPSASQRDAAFRLAVSELRARCEKIINQRDRALAAYSGRPSQLANYLRSSRDAAIGAYDQSVVDLRWEALRKAKRKKAPPVETAPNLTSDVQVSQHSESDQDDEPMTADFDRTNFSLYAQILVSEAYRVATAKLADRSYQFQTSQLRAFIKKNLLGLTPNLTRLGNIIASYKLYPAIAYGLDGEVYWPWLRFKLSDDDKGAKILEAIVDRRLALDFCVTMATLCLVAIPVWLLLIIGVLGAGGWFLSALAFFGFGLAAYVFYDASTGSAESLGDFIGAAYDSIMHSEPTPSGARSSQEDAEGPAHRHDVTIARVWAATTGPNFVEPITETRGQSLLAGAVLAGLIVVSVIGFRPHWPVKWALVSQVALAECQIIDSELATKGFRLQLLSASTIEAKRPASSDRCVMPMVTGSATPVVQIALKPDETEIELQPLSNFSETGQYILDRDVLPKLALIRPIGIGSVLTSGDVAMIPLGRISLGDPGNFETAAGPGGDISLLSSIYYIDWGRDKPATDNPPQPAPPPPALAGEGKLAFVTAFWFPVCSASPYGTEQLRKVKPEEWFKGLVPKFSEKGCENELSKADPANLDLESYFGSSQAAYGKLEQTISLKGIQFVVVGHADQSGEATLNADIAERRADVVHALLIRAGATDAQIGDARVGESLPIFPLKQDQQFQLNRRVDVIGVFPEESYGDFTKIMNGDSQAATLK